MKKIKQDIMYWTEVGRRVGSFLEVLTGPCLKWQEGRSRAKTGTERAANAKALRWQQFELSREQKEGQ